MSETDLTDVEDLDDTVHFPVEEIVQYPLPGCVLPVSPTFSPDDELVSYLLSPDYTKYKKVFIFDPNASERELEFGAPTEGIDDSNLSPERKLLERLKERGLGVTSYEWVKTNSRRKAIMVPLPAGIYIHDFYYSETELKVPSTPESPIVDPHPSPDGSMLSYVRDCELHVVSLIYYGVKQLTYGAKKDSLTHGLAEYIAQEEMERKAGYWWSPDSEYIAFTEVDYSEIPLFRITRQGEKSVGSEAQEDHAYPFAGASNVKVRLGVVSVFGGSTTWMDLVCGGKGHEDNEEEYLARVKWMPGNILSAQVLNRTHTKIKILQFDITTGERKTLLVEENETWINLHHCFTPLDTRLAEFAGGFVWASEKTGFRHLYIHDASGTCLAPITDGNWMVEKVVGVNEARGLIYFTGTFDGPLESHLYCAQLFVDGSEPLEAPIRITRGKGKHLVVLDHQMERFIDTHESLDDPPQVVLCSLHDGRAIFTLYDQPLPFPRFRRLQLKAPEIVEIQAKDGTPLSGLLYKPDPSRFGPPPYKTMINVYGGPGVQFVSDSWLHTIDMRAQYLRSKGILVWKSSHGQTICMLDVSFICMKKTLMLDNRGAGRRGLKFEAPLKYNLGQVEGDDQVTGAEWLIEQGLAEAGHIGLYGWSYGGYLSAMTFSRYPDMFKCAVAGAPVTSWDGYDTFYTEKYLGLPSKEEDAYENSSVLNHVHKLQEGRLMILHGLIDGNVHFRHTARLVSALVEAKKPYELVIFPDERHLPQLNKSRLYMEQRISDFIDENL
ncbi:Dipeptidyl aminopeptidase 4 [Senna tora]|uniref:Dipeptidyl aminopeptidase 4 n=1 Tax=Senna tora TaxID=362788 RepID=A0A834U017_9FABA|nr:Dipeptidyl aminopeptidase 4 [Senna tora]